MTQTKNTLNELILSINRKNVFIKSPDESDITYGELISYMEDTFNKLSSIKINKEDKIAIVIENGSSMACTFIAIAANYTSCPLNPSYTKEEFKFYYNDLSVKAVIIEENKSIEARFNEAVFPLKRSVRFTLDGVPLSNKHILIPACPNKIASDAPATPPPTMIASYFT